MNVVVDVDLFGFRVDDEYLFVTDVGDVVAAAGRLLAVCFPLLVLMSGVGVGVRV